jgi:hypothetical protein
MALFPDKGVAEGPGPLSVSGTDLDHPTSRRHVSEDVVQNAVRPSGTSVPDQKVFPLLWRHAPAVDDLKELLSQVPSALGGL